MELVVDVFSPRLFGEVNGLTIHKGEYYFQFV